MSPQRRRCSTLPGTCEESSVRADGASMSMREKPFTTTITRARRRSRSRYFPLRRKGGPFSLMVMMESATFSRMRPTVGRSGTTHTTMIRPVSSLTACGLESERYLQLSELYVLSNVCTIAFTSNITFQARHPEDFLNHREGTPGRIAFPAPSPLTAGRISKIII